MSPRAFAFTAPVLLLLLAGCSADPASSDLDTVVATDTTIVATEYAFEPQDITVPAGEVTFTIRNDGSEEHEFEILQGDRVIDEAEGLIPGLERDLKVTLEPGDYLIVCRLADHFERGMRGTLTVSG